MITVYIHGQVHFGGKGGKMEFFHATDGSETTCKIQYSASLPLKEINWMLPLSAEKISLDSPFKAEKTPVDKRARKINPITPLFSLPKINIGLMTVMTLLTGL
jgi:hypothetical protein